MRHLLGESETYSLVLLVSKQKMEDQSGGVDAANDEHSHGGIPARWRTWAYPGLMRESAIMIPERHHIPVTFFHATVYFFESMQIPWPSR